MAQKGEFNNGFKTIRADHSDISPALRDVDPWPTERVQEHEAAQNPRINTGAHKDAPDTVVQRKTLLGQLAPSIPDPILNFAGIPFPGVNCNCAPPDTNGEVGTTQYVQIVNTGYQVFDKATGSSLLGPASIVSVWTGFGGVCQTAGNGDPVVLFDQIANRWVITQFAGGLTHECVAVSTTDDATGTYARYDYNLAAVAGSALYDYPHLGVWPDAYYMSMNVFNTSGTAYLGPQAFAFNRAKMIAGDPTAELIVAPRLSSNDAPMQPADLDGHTLPPAGAPNSFVLFPDTNNYRVYHFQVDFANPANSTFTLFGSSPTAGFSFLCPNTGLCVPQLGQPSTQNLNGLADRLMYRLAYRNFGDHESLVGNFSVSSGGVSGVRWFELRGVSAGPVTTFQEGTYQPDNTWRWMGSAAMDGAGNIAVAYSASSSAIFPQLRYTGRMATDPLGTLPLGEATLWEGTGAQVNTSSRWGDYSDLTVDPDDDQTFWFTSEYYDSTSSFNWRTRIGSFKLATGGGGGANLVSAASRLRHNNVGTFDVPMPLSGTSGVEDRAANNYVAVFTFDTAVTSGDVSVVSGTATAGTPAFNGNEITVPLTGVDNAQVVTLRVENVNGSGTSAGDVPFGFLIGDIDSSRTVDSGDRAALQSAFGNPVDGTSFRADIKHDGDINRRDRSILKSELGTSLP
ncbi:MAG: dockerin type I domain-containing protein [Spartobacteria bacterium]